MKIVGFWHVETPRERLLLRIAFGYAVWAILFAILVEGVDLYHCINDFYVSDRHAFSSRDSPEQQSPGEYVSPLTAASW